MSSACTTDALNVQRTSKLSPFQLLKPNLLAAAEAAAVRTKQLPKPGSGPLKLVFESPPQESDTRCSESGERNNDFVYVKRVDPNGMRIDVHTSSITVTTDIAD